jgi:hypothetical protein
MLPAIAKSVRLPSLCLLGVALWVLFAALPRVGEDFTYTRVSTEVSFWGRKGYYPSEATKAQTQIDVESLRAASPEHPELLVLAADVSAWNGYYSAQAVEAEASLQRAAQLSWQALALRPANLITLGKLADYATAAGLYDLESTAQSHQLKLRPANN